MSVSRIIPRLSQSINAARPLWCAKPTTSLPLRYFTASASNNGRVSEPIIHDHRELEEQYNNILNARNADEKERWQNQFTWELARHSIAEEIVIYPLLEQHVTSGQYMAQKDRDQHNKIKELLYKFEKLRATDPDFEPTIKELWSVLGQHIKEEESDDLPMLEKELSESESNDAASSFDMRKKIVPTRSHPSAPDKPPMETIAGLFAGPMDKIGDLFRKFPKKQ